MDGWVGGWVDKKRNKKCCFSQISYNYVPRLGYSNNMRLAVEITET